MSFLQIFSLLLLSSLLVECYVVRKVVYQRTDDGPISQSLRISWYQFLTEDRSKSSLEGSEQIKIDQDFSDSEEYKEEKLNSGDKASFEKDLYSKENLFKSLVASQVKQLCSGVCSGPFGFCNNGCECSGGLCVPIGQTAGLVNDYGGSRLISTSDESNEINSLTASKSDYLADIDSNRKVNAKLPDCYWTACVQFNEASCADGYKMLTKMHCGNWLLNYQRKWCCKI